ncbi:MAG: helix-turn-helix domain-containing protein, partial [Armatimonadota bacterium]
FSLHSLFGSMSTPLLWGEGPGCGSGKALGAPQEKNEAYLANQFCPSGNSEFLGPSARTLEGKRVHKPSQDERLEESILKPSIIPQFEGKFALPPKETARVLGIGRTKLYELIANGTLRSIKIGSRRLITVEAIQQCLAMHEVNE